MPFTYSEIISVALGIQQAMGMRRIVICDLSDSTMFFHIISQTARFSRGKNIIEYEMCVLSFSTILSETFLILKRIK
jgi:hypothetical protein